MQDKGKSLEVIQGHGNLGDGERKEGLWVLILKNDASRTDIEAIRDLLQGEINALLLMESAFKEMRHLDPFDLRELKASVDDALGLSELPVDAKGVVTPERVVAALEKSPGILRGVLQLLQKRQYPGV